MPLLKERVVIWRASSGGRGGTGQDMLSKHSIGSEQRLIRNGSCKLSVESSQVVILERFGTVR